MTSASRVFSQQDRSLLAEGISQLSLKLPEADHEKCLLFLSELQLWSRAFNMTAIREPREMIIRHVLDSLAVADFLVGDRILDVGTGAGLPGIPLSIARPDCSFYLLDSNQKKQVFVAHVIKLLDLSNAQGIHSAVEAYQVTSKFSTIITRAFAPLTEMIASTAHLLSDEGRFLAMMGKRPESADPLPSGYEMEALVPVKIPFGTGERHIALIKKS